jgi:hypothetical protein
MWKVVPAWSFVSFVVYALAREAAPGRAFGVYVPPRLRKQLHRILQLPLESLDTAPRRFGMGLAYCSGGVKSKSQELKATPAP